MNLVFPFEADEDSPRFAADDLQRSALDQLRCALTDKLHTVRLHAAESLHALGFGAEVLPRFEEALERDGHQAVQRVCIWRVLALAEPSSEKRQLYLERIREAYLNPDSPDPACAVESLAKLRYRIDAEHLPRYEQVVKKLPTVAVPHARWLFAVGGDSRYLESLADLLESSDPLVRGVTAYALRHLREHLPATIIDRIAAAAIAEPASPGRKYLIGAAFVTALDADRAATYKALLVEYIRKGDNDEKYAAASALAIRGDRLDLALLADLLRECDADVRVAAATAVLQILCRPGPLTTSRPHMPRDPPLAQCVDLNQTRQREG